MSDDNELNDWQKLVDRLLGEVERLVADNGRLRADNESIRIAHSKDVTWAFTDDDMGWFVQPSATNEQLRDWRDRLLAAISSNDLWDEAERVAAEVRAEMEER